MFTWNLADAENLAHGDIWLLFADGTMLIDDAEFGITVL